MLGIDSELETLYTKAQRDGVAVIKDRWTPGNYGCCSTRAPLVEKYKIEHIGNTMQLHIWGKLAVTVDLKNQTSVVNENYPASNYEKRIIDWFSQKAKK